MPRPCTCDRFLPGVTFRPGADCVRCWLWHNSEDYRDHHEGRRLRTAPPARRPCRHLGGPTGGLRECATCSGSVRVKLFACRVFGECTTGQALPGVACCVGCRSYEAPPG